jgi:sporulation protein YlmC with PRC-barrel domain
MCKLRIALFTVIFVLGTVMAATDTTQSMTPGSSSMTAKTTVLQSANKIMGADIKTTNGEKIGTVKELIVNQSKDDVQYVIVSADDMLHPVPFTALKCSADTNTSSDANIGSERTYLTLNMTKDQLHSAPSIESIDTTNLSDPTMKQKIDSYYSTQMKETESMWNKMKSEVKERMPSSLKGSETATKAEGQMRLIKASDLIGMDVKGLNDENLAEIKDLVIDTRKGNVAYGILGYGGVLGVKERQSAVPWSAISIQPDNKVAKLDATQDKLDSAALTEGKISQLNQKQFAQHVHEVFGVEPYWQVYGFEAPGEESGTMQKQTDTERQLRQQGEKYKQEQQQKLQDRTY